jgi:DNA-binding CsgD family transcriptional regulator
MENTHPILTKEERNVLILASVHPNLKHLSIREIGQCLGLPDARVKSIIHQACQKLGADNRNEAVLMSLRQGEININELLSLNELAEILRTVEPDVIRLIANRIRHDQVQKSFPVKGQPIMPLEKRHAGLLTNRERDVLILSAQGQTNNEIAEKLFMSADAVRTFLNRAFNKLGASKKADAVQLALKLKEINVGEISSLDELAYYLAPLGADTIDELAKLVEETQQE